MSPKAAKAKAKTAEAAPHIKPALSLPRFSPGWRLLIFPLCVLSPGAGAALGLLYARQDDAEARRFGYLCLGLGCLGALAAAWRAGDFHGIKSADTINQPFY